MASMEPFEVVSRPANVDHVLFDDYKEMLSGKAADIDVQLLVALRSKYPELIITSTPASNVSLLAFAATGNATAELDIENESVVRWRGFIGPRRRGGTGGLADAIFFAKYRYNWAGEEFILYTAVVGLVVVQYILKEPRGKETVLSNSSVTDSLLSTIGAFYSQEVDAVYVFDGFWTRSVAMWNEVQKANWDQVILDPKMKKALTSVSNKFFDSEDVYKEYGVPWKRGLIYHGPPGNGKTISIKALMHSMYQRDRPIPTLYVKSAPYTYQINSVFALARQEAPCLLILEDIETIVTNTTRSYFLNEVDGIATNDGILMVASTNHLDRLDPGLSKRPSRFDRKYFFPLPDKSEREMYCEYWRQKVKDKPIDFPKKLCAPIAGLTDGFSFAYIQEAFMSSLLVIARGEDDDDDDDSDEEEADAVNNSRDTTAEDLNKYQLWRVIKKQIKLLRDELGDEDEEKKDDTVKSEGNVEDPFQHATNIPPPPPPPGPSVHNGAEFDGGFHEFVTATFSGDTQAGNRGLSADTTRPVLRKKLFFDQVVNSGAIDVPTGYEESIPGGYCFD